MRVPCAIGANLSLPSFLFSIQMNDLAGAIQSRHHKLTCCILALISASCHPSTNIIGFVSGELQPRGGVLYHAASPALFPREGLRANKHRKKRRRSSSRHGIIPFYSSMRSPLLDLRCGGTDESNVEEEEEAITEEHCIDGSSEQQPLMDISVVASADSSTDNAIEENNEVVEESPGSGMMTQASDPESNENNNESDLSKSGMNADHLGTSFEDALSSDAEIDAGSGVESAVESSDDSDIPTEEIMTSQTEIITAASEADSDTDDDGGTKNQQSQHLLRSSASDKRAEGKTLHDAGSLNDAARAFREAALLLDEAIASSESSDVEDVVDDINSIAVERATCRLHEALCLLKDGRPGACIEACTDVLEDGVTVVPLESGKGDGDSGEDDDADGSKPIAVVKIVPVPSPTSSTTSHSASTIPPQIRARAHHRRAKARLALGDLDGALEDARSAAFMGDRNAVQFYGRLMREGSGAGDSSSTLVGGLGDSLPFGGPEGSAGGTSNSFLEGMLNGMSGDNNPLMPSGAGSSDFSSSLLSSLLTGDGGTNPFGMMGDLLAPPDNENEGKSRRGRRRRGKKKKDSLAKSVLSSLMKRVEDKGTQEKICNYLRSTNTRQIMSFAAMAGVPMKEESARRLVTMANGVTPRGISKGVSKVKRGISIFKTARNILKVVDKYKAVIILAVLFYWVRSAIVAPYPISKKKKEAAEKLAQKAALSLLIMPSFCSQNKSLGNLCGGMVKAFSSLYSIGSENIDEGKGGSSASKTGIEEELERLQNQLSLIEALEERNKAQIESFVDEEDQWQSLEEEERDLLNSKYSIMQKIEELSEQLVMLFMGQKMRNG